MRLWWRAKAVKSGRRLRAGEGVRSVTPAVRSGGWVYLIPSQILFNHLMSVNVWFNLGAKNLGYNLVVGYRFFVQLLLSSKAPLTSTNGYIFSSDEVWKRALTLALLLPCLTYWAMQGHGSSSVECPTSQPLSHHVGLHGASKFSLESSVSGAYAALVISSEHKCQSVNNLVEFI
jgi:hypothetical protein